MSVAFTRKATLRSAMLITGATYVAYVSGMAGNVLIARSLGPADYGRYAYIVWLSGMLVVLCNNGLTISGIRFVSELMGRKDPAGAQQVHGTLASFHRLSLVATALVFAAIVPLVKPSGWTYSLVLFGAATLLSALPKSAYLFRSSIAKGYGEFGVEAATTNAMSIASLAGMVLLWLLGGTLTHYLALFVVISIGHALMAAVLLRRRNITPSSDALETSVKARMREHLFWSTVLTMVAAFGNKSVETILLNSMVGAEAVGFFAIASAFARGGVELLSSGLNGVLMTAMAHAFGSGGVNAANRVLSDALRYFTFLGLFLAGVGGLWASPVITLLYGADYAATILALQVMMVVGGLTLSSGAFGALLSTTGNQKVRAYYAVAAILVSAACAAIFVPPFGLNGALMSIVASQLILLSLGPLTIKYFMDVQFPIRELLRLHGAALLAAAVSLPFLFWSRSSLVQFGLGAVYGASYLCFTVPLRVWHQRDIDTLAPLTMRVPLLERIERVLRRYVPSSDS